MSETREARTSTEQVNGVAFERFWASYPRKVGKAAARKAFDKALTRADLAQIVEGLHRYVKDPERVRKGQEFTVHPVTWLNQDRWLDDLAVVPSVRVVDLTKRFENTPEGITFDVWLRDHASPDEVDKARQFGVGRSLKEAGA
jgi:hypothetical protein